MNISDVKNYLNKLMQETIMSEHPAQEFILDSIRNVWYELTVLEKLLEDDYS